MTIDFMRKLFGNTMYTVNVLAQKEFKFEICTIIEHCCFLW